VLLGRLPERHAHQPQSDQEFGDKYRKIRNTLRYLLSNLYDFKSPSMSRPTASTAGRWRNWISSSPMSPAAYDAYQLHRAFRLLHDFCAVQISAVYGNAMKDRLYCEAANSPIRRRCQTVMQRMAVALCKLLAPMIVFTADEAWEHAPGKTAAEQASVHLALLPQSSGAPVCEDWKLLMELRDSALAQLDKLKKEAGMNKALDAEVIYHVADAMSDRKINIAVLVGGGGRSLQNLHEQIAAGRLAARIGLVIASRPGIGAIERAAAARLPLFVAEPGKVFAQCDTAGIDLVCLAGWMSLLEIPPSYAGRVMNIHPALLPSFGGRGFYGARVHQAVLKQGCKVSGCTVHFVDAQYDNGPIILQRTCPVAEDDTPQMLAARVFEEEKIAYPAAIQLYSEKRLVIEGRRVRVLPTC
jgi:phosphoribosylglycinamide formyltransferase 1